MRTALLIPLLFLSNIVAIEKNWQNTNYIWDFGMVHLCDKGMHNDPWRYFASEPVFDVSAYANLEAGDLVWVRCEFIPEFCRTVLPTLTVPIALLISDGDESFPSDCGASFRAEELFDHKNIIQIFAQNCDYTGTHQKLCSIPIGMDFHTIAYKNVRGGWGELGSPLEQEHVLKQLLSTFKPTKERIKKAYVDFQHSDTMHGGFKRYLQFGEDRKSIFMQVKQTGLVDYDNTFMRRSLLWKKKGEYAFSISPHGNGLDCHRTWEDMVLGCIIIVKTSSLDPLYEGLPIVIVKDWSELTSENFDKWLDMYGDAFTNPHYREKLTHGYWYSKLRKVLEPYKS